MTSNVYLRKYTKNNDFYLNIKQVCFTQKTCIFRNLIFYDQHNIFIKMFARALRRAPFFNIIWVNIIFFSYICPFFQENMDFCNVKKWRSVERAPKRITILRNTSLKVILVLILGQYSKIMLIFYLRKKIFFSSKKNSENEGNFPKKYTKMVFCT